MHFYWQLLSPLRYTKVIHLFGKPRSVVLMPKKLMGRLACLYCARLAHHVHVVLVVKMNMMIVMTMVGIVKLISGWKYDK